MRQLRRPRDFRELQRYIQAQHRLPVGGHIGASPWGVHFQGRMARKIPSPLFSNNLCF